MKHVLLWGGRSTARIAQEMVLAMADCEIAVIFDGTLEQPAFETTATFVSDVDRLGGLLGGCSHFVVCVGGAFGYARHEIAKRLQARGLAPLALVHERAFIEPTASHGSGCHFMANAVLGKFSRVGDQVILNTGCTVDHECVVGHGCHIMGGASVAGRVRIDDYASIGTNATILPDVRVGRGAYVGAGAVVTRDVPELSVCVGTPARAVGQHELKANLEEMNRL